MPDRLVRLKNGAIGVQAFECTIETPLAMCRDGVVGPVLVDRFNSHAALLAERNALRAALGFILKKHAPVDGTCFCGGRPSYPGCPDGIPGCHHDECHPDCEFAQACKVLVEIKQ